MVGLIMSNFLPCSFSPFRRFFLRNSWATKLPIYLCFIGFVLPLSPQCIANTPYSGTPFNGPHIPPSTIQCEDYDKGGPGIGYNNSDPNNTGGGYRPDYVQIEPCSDVGSGFDVGRTATGEWLQYTVQVPSSGLYLVSFRVASYSTGGNLHLEDETGANLTGQVTVPITGGWQAWTTVNASASLSVGTHVLRLVEDSGGYNLN